LRILVVGLNYAPEPVGIGPYTQGLADALVSNGHEVHAVVGNPYYPRWKLHDGFNARGGTSCENGVAVHRCRHYIPRNPTGSRRILHHLSFALSAFLPAVREAMRFRPSLIIAIAPSLIAAPVAIAAARLCRARTWLHVQDFEVEAAFATGLLNGHGIIGRLALRFQRRTIQAFDTCSSISPQMCAKLRGIGVPQNRVVTFRNWSNTDDITPLARPSKYRSEWNITANTVALYAGNIANKQGIGIIVEAASRLRGRSDILFLICGDGPSKDALIAAADGLPNIQFRPLQPIEDLSELLGLATMHLLPQLAGAADLVLPSKLANMLASGRPVIATADSGTGLASEVAGCGIVTTPGDIDAFVNAISTLSDDSERCAKIGRAARLRAELHWSRDAILGELLQSLDHPE